MKVWYSILLVLGLATVISTQGQKTHPSHDGSLGQPVPTNFLLEVSSKSKKLNAKLDRQAFKALQQWKKTEAKIIRKLEKTDSLKAAAMSNSGVWQLQQLEKKLQNEVPLQTYIPSLDTLSSSLKFLQYNPQHFIEGAESKEKIEEALSSVKGLQTQFQKAEDIKAFLKQRKEHLREQLNQLPFARELQKFNRQVYYYGARVNEFKSLLSDHKQAEKKALELLSKSKSFQTFLRKNSMLAALFRVPGGQGEPDIATTNLSGLQTRAQVNGLIEAQLTGGGPKAQAQFQQSLQDAKAKLNELQSRVISQGGSTGDNEPANGFRPNDQKSKSFLGRLEAGINMQSQKPNGYFPVTSDLGISLGYKLNDRSLIGLGASYKMGWGKNISHISISHQGISLRSFVDWKIKDSFWMTGGYELNYQSMFNNIEELKNYSAWQRSGLIGVSKVISMNSRFFKKTKIQLLWDLLSYNQIPVTRPIVLRMGYSFK